jgi:hypothetical protein
MEELVDLMIEADESLLALLPTVADVEKTLNIEHTSAGGVSSSSATSDTSAATTATTSSSSSSTSSSSATSTTNSSQQQQQTTVDLVEAVARQGWLFKQSPAFHKVFSIWFSFLFACSSNKFDFATVDAKEIFRLKVALLVLLENRYDNIYSLFVYFLHSLNVCLIWGRFTEASEPLGLLKVCVVFEKNVFDNLLFVTID